MHFSWRAMLSHRQADASGHVREMEEAVLTLRNKFLAQVADRDREIQVPHAYPLHI